MITRHWFVYVDATLSVYAGWGLFQTSKNDGTGEPDIVPTQADASVTTKSLPKVTS